MLQIVTVLSEIGASHCETAVSRHMSTRYFTVIVNVSLDDWTVHFFGLFEFKVSYEELGVSGVRFVLRIPMDRPTNVPV